MTQTTLAHRMTSSLSVLTMACLLGACSSIDVNAVSLNGMVEYLVPPYVNYAGVDAARVRVIYGNSGNPYITVKGDSMDEKLHTIKKGERINKTMMGTMWNWAPISLGMPGTPPQYAYTEISVPGGRTVTLQIAYHDQAGTRLTTCSPTLDLPTVAGANYEVQLRLRDKVCFVHAQLI